VLVKPNLLYFLEIYCIMFLTYAVIPCVFGFSSKSVLSTKAKITQNNKMSNPMEEGVFDDFLSTLWSVPVALPSRHKRVLPDLEKAVYGDRAIDDQEFTELRRAALQVLQRHIPPLKKFVAGLEDVPLPAVDRLVVLWWHHARTDKDAKDHFVEDVSALVRASRVSESREAESTTSSDRRAMGRLTGKPAEVSRMVGLTPKAEMSFEELFGIAPEPDVRVSTRSPHPHATTPKLVAEDMQQQIKQQQAALAELKRQQLQILSLLQSQSAPAVAQQELDHRVRPEQLGVHGSGMSYTPFRGLKECAVPEEILANPRRWHEVDPHVLRGDFERHFRALCKPGNVMKEVEKLLENDLPKHIRCVINSTPYSDGWKAVVEVADGFITELHRKAVLSSHGFATSRLLMHQVALQAPNLAPSSRAYHYAISQSFRAPTRQGANGAMGGSTEEQH
jgi:hypothetical protein